MDLIAELTGALGDGAVLVGSAVGTHCRSDASGSGLAQPRALLRPNTIEAVSDALAICHKHGVTLVPQGGMTGLAGGANPRPGDIALSLDRLNRIEQIDPESSTITLQAGCILQRAQEAASAEGLLLPIDLGSRGSCQIGGLIATNAGGLRVIRHGMTRDNLIGLEVVLANGTLLSNLGKMVKNNTGYDLRHLFCGSEGTLGVITRAVLRLRPLPTAKQTALVALADYQDVVTLLSRARNQLHGLSAFEAMWRSYFSLSQSCEGLMLFDDPPPFAVILEVESDAGPGPAAAFENFLGAALEDGILNNALIAQSDSEASRFWAVREGHRLYTALPDVINLDVSMALGQIGSFADACAQALSTRYPVAHVSFFGHIGDSNLHVAVSAPEGGLDAAHVVDDIVYDLVRKFHGSVSAEHGIGTLKRAYLGHSRSNAEIAAMRAIKTALDPEGMMNPGKVLH
jgi:FAD/FMN-containing dehydrogenase